MFQFDMCRSSLKPPVRRAVKRWFPYFVLWTGCLVTPVLFPQSSTETPHVWVLTVFEEPLSVPSVASASTMRYSHMWSNSVASLVATLLRLWYLLLSTLLGIKVPNTSLIKWHGY